VLFDLQRRTVGETEVVSVVGDLDLASLPRLATALGDLGGSRPDGAVTLDLEGVDYMDPVCLGALVAADLRVRRAGGVMTVRAGEPILALLAETRLNRILTVEGS
jgi:anti-anti-sigma factor